MASEELIKAAGRKEFEKISHWAYVLNCTSRFRYDSFDDLERRSEKRLGRKPDWLRKCYESRRYYYVGQTEDIFKRLGEHYGKNKSAEFLQLYKPRGIEALYPEYSRNSAEHMERRLGKSYDEDPDAFAYWY